MFTMHRQFSHLQPGPTLCQNAVPNSHCFQVYVHVCLCLHAYVYTKFLLPRDPKRFLYGMLKYYYVFFVGETYAQFLHREQLFVFLQKKVTIEGKSYSSVTHRPLISTNHSTWCQIRWLQDFSVQWPAVCVCSSGGGELLCVSSPLCSCHL